MILDTLADESTVANDEMSDKNEDGAGSEKSDDLDGSELTSSRSATPVSTAATTVSSAGIKGKKRKRSKGEMIDDLV